MVRVFSLARYLSLPTTLSTEERRSSSILTLRLSRPSDPEDEGEVVTEVAWIGPDELLVRMTDRSARVERIGRFDLAAAEWQRKSADAEEQVLEGEVVRETDWWEKDGGWVEAVSLRFFGRVLLLIRRRLTSLAVLVRQAQTIVSISPPATSDGPPSRDYPPGYLDLVPDANGFVHVAYFSPSTSSAPIFLTSGEWEVAGGIDKVDLERGLMCVPKL